VKALQSRVKKLEADRPRFTEENCPRPMIGAQVDEGEPLPREEDVVSCRTCGGRHVQRVVEVVVEAPQ
jgi:hypothetical protein